MARMTGMTRDSNHHASRVHDIACGCLLARLAVHPCLVMVIWYLSALHP